MDALVIGAGVADLLFKGASVGNNVALEDADQTLLCNFGTGLARERQGGPREGVRGALVQIIYI